MRFEVRGFRFEFALLLGIALVLFVAACGGDDDDGGGGGGGGSLTELLSAIPDTPATAGYVSYADLDAYYGALGVGSPPREASEGDWDEWLGELGQAENSGDYARLVAGPQFAIDALREQAAFRAEIGLDPATVKQALESGTPPETYTVLRGDFNPGDVANAVRSDENFNDLLQEEAYGGVSYYAWGEDFEQDPARNSPVHSLGRGGRLALDGDLLYWCFWTDGITGMIDAQAGTAPSLADRADFASMAAGLDGRNVYSVQLFTGDAAILTFDEPVEPVPVVAVASGAGTDDEGPFLVLMMTHENPADAAANVATIEDAFANGRDIDGNPWSAQIDSVDASSDGTLSIAVLRGPNLPYDLWVSGSLVSGN